MIPDGRFSRVRFRPWLFLPPPAQRRGGSSAGSHTPLSAVVGMRNSSVLTGRSCPAQCPGPPKDRQVPRASSHSRGITPCVAAFTPHRWALPHPRRYYRPMRQTPSLSPPTTTGLGRRVFAGCGQPLLGSGPSRRYLCRSFSGCQAPCRGGSSRCTCPLLPSTTSAFPDKGTGRPSRENPLSDFRAGMISQLQAFRNVLASRFACHPGRSHRCGLAAGQPWRFHPSTTCVVTFARFGYASRPNRAIDGWGLSPHKTRSLVGCSPLILVPELSTGGREARRSSRPPVGNSARVHTSYPHAEPPAMIGPRRPKRLTQARRREGHFPLVLETPGQTSPRRRCRTAKSPLDAVPRAPSYKGRPVCARPAWAPRPAPRKET